MNIPFVFKKCTKCGEWLVANKINFYKSKNGKYGLESQCKECRNRKQKEKYANNNEWKEERLRKNREYHKKKYDNDEEWRNERNRKSKEYLREKRMNDEWREEQNRKQREKCANDKEYKEKQLRKQRKWQKNNPEKIFNYNNERRNKEKNQGRGITKEQWLEMFKFFNFECAYSGIQLTKDNRSVDHIIPLDSNGENEPWNCVPMLKSYNCSKRNRNDSLIWYKEQEYFDEERLNKIVEWQIYAYEKWGGEEFGELILITDMI